MLLKIWIHSIFGFVMIHPLSSAQSCVRRYLSCKWIPPVAEDENEWTVFQRRINGHVDFDRVWDDYVKGFGDRDGDFWLGLEELHERTKNVNTELEINMATKDTGTHWVVQYSNFRIGPGSDNYRLNVSGFSGNVTYDSLSYHNNRQFSTKDADHDNHWVWNCAEIYEAAWWYGACAESNLNGHFNKTSVRGIWWHKTYKILRYSEMRFRRKL